MIQIKSYESGIVRFYCGRCDVYVEQDINELLKDDSVLDVDIICPSCKDVYVLYVLKCIDESLMKSLNAELIVLKERRKKELEE